MSGYQDSNLGPPGPKPGALPDCATSRNIFFVDHVGIEPTTLSLQGRNAKPWYMTAHVSVKSSHDHLYSFFTYSSVVAQCGTTLTEFCGPTGNRTRHFAVTGRYYSRLTMRPWRGTGYLFLLGTPSDPLSERPGSNWRPQPWQGCALPTELLSQMPKTFLI